MMTRERRGFASSFFNQKATPTHSKIFCFSDDEEGVGYLNDDEGRREVVRMFTSSFFNQKATPTHSKSFCLFYEEFAKFFGF